MTESRLTENLQTEPLVLKRVNTDAAAEQEYQVGTSRCLIGSGPGSDIQVSDSAEASIWCELIRNPLGLFVRQLESAVLVNGQELSDGWLYEGDRLEVAGHQFEVIRAGHVVLEADPGVKTEPSSPENWIEPSRDDTTQTGESPVDPSQERVYRRLSECPTEIDVSGKRWDQAAEPDLDFVVEQPESIQTETNEPLQDACEDEAGCPASDTGINHGALDSPEARSSETQNEPALAFPIETECNDTLVFDNLPVASQADFGNEPSGEEHETCLAELKKYCEEAESAATKDDSVAESVEAATGLSELAQPSADISETPVGTLHHGNTGERITFEPAPAQVLESLEAGLDIQQQEAGDTLVAMSQPVPDEPAVPPVTPGQQLDAVENLLRQFQEECQSPDAGSTTRATDHPVNQGPGFGDGTPHTPLGNPEWEDHGPAPEEYVNQSTEMESVEDVLARMIPEDSASQMEAEASAQPDSADFEIPHMDTLDREGPVENEIQHLAAEDEACSDELVQEELAPEMGEEPVKPVNKNVATDEVEKDPEVPADVKPEPVMETVAEVLARMRAAGNLDHCEPLDDQETAGLAPESGIAADDHVTQQLSSRHLTEVEEEAVNVAGDAGQEGSVQDYMTQLMSRLNAGPGAAMPPQPASTTGSSATSKPEKPVQNTRDDEEEDLTPVNPLSEGEYKPGKVAPEKMSTLHALRQVANQSVENAIRNSAREKDSEASMIYLGGSGACLCISAVLFMLSKGVFDIVFILAVVFAIGCVGAGFMFVSITHAREKMIGCIDRIKSRGEGVSAGKASPVAKETPDQVS